MVGVPGRSKGCNTCRKRKVKCDQSKPECMNCIKTNRNCTGYHRTIVFHNSTTSVATGVTTTTADPPAAALGAAAAFPPPRRSTLDTIVGSAGTRPATGAALASRRLTARARTALDMMAFSLTVAPSATPHHRSGFVAIFLDGFTPAKANLCGVPSAWLHTIPSSINNGVSVFDAAVTAMCTAFAARQSKDERLLQESTRMYLHALAELKKAVADREMGLKDETVAATLSLGIYETLACVSVDGWQRHARGTAVLIQQRGPEAHIHGVAHFLFSSYRSLGLFDAIITRKSTFLSLPAWTTTPWTNIRKRPLHELQDILTTLPSLLEEEDSLPASSRPEILSRCISLHSRLTSWYDSFTATHPGTLYWPEFSTFLTSPPVFPTRWNFATMAIANILTLNWTCLILLYTTMLTLSYPAPPPACASFSEICGLADNICMGMEYYLCSERKAFGPFLALFPLRVAFECFKNSGKRAEVKVQWCRKLYGILGDKGLALGEMLEETSWRKKSDKNGGESLG